MLVYAVGDYEVVDGDWLGLAYSVDSGCGGMFLARFFAALVRWAVLFLQ